MKRWLIGKVSSPTHAANDARLLGTSRVRIGQGSPRTAATVPTCGPAGDGARLVGGSSSHLPLLPSETAVAPCMYETNGPSSTTGDGSVSRSHGPPPCRYNRVAPMMMASAPLTVR